MISSLKESFGFIETADAEREFFFHFSEFQGKASDLQICMHVTYELTERQGKTIAHRVAKADVDELTTVDVR